MLNSKEIRALRTLDSRMMRYLRAQILGDGSPWKGLDTEDYTLDGIILLVA